MYYWLLAASSIWIFPYGYFIMEYLITEYLLKHKEGITDLLHSLKCSTEINPILKSHFRDAILVEVVQLLAKQLNSNVEDIYTIVDHKFLSSLLGEDWFERMD